MPKIKYIDRRFSASSLDLIETANHIIAEYEAQGFDLTLRQLYYQFVARDIIPNNERSYKRLGSVINDARLAGFIDWARISDRTRFLRALGHWQDPGHIIESAALSYHVDKWRNQQYRLEVHIEKDALVGVIENVCNVNDVPFFSCRGYVSQSEMWATAQRLLSYARLGQTPVILHFGDHDPSGMDMTRDIQDRLEMFADGCIEIRRLALNMDQIERFSPPPNPAKTTDSRYTGYIAQFGHESWELDALEPKIIVGLIERAVKKLRDPDAWAEATAREDLQRAALQQASSRWGEITQFLEETEQ